MKNYKDLISRNRIPRHVAIIMDGNGRWAKKKSLPRAEGHKRGAEVIEPLMDSAIELGIKAVSLYAFSTENWLRPQTEIFALWRLLEYFFKTRLEKIKGRGIKIRHSGSLDKLPSGTREIIKNAVEETKNNKKAVLNFCLNYGGRQEIVHAVNSWLEKRKPGEPITASKIEKNLYTSGLPGVDLLIRTSGESRISNFLIWQIAYTELVFLDVLWPDFGPSHLYRCIYEYQNRERRYGGI
ncbi:MAG: polyprenyl diphosphate synthase [Spirochaetes bacterium]|jgi:undecaprenyl diphosphate synthase|nr:polyprenyl diphosphate synthase [Spirochaetota bacterium]